MNTYIVKGDICFSRSMDEIVCLEQGSIVVEQGRVTGVFQTLPERYAALPVLDYGRSLILPGMSDLHVHAPQFAFRGLGMDMELLEWLNTYTFPEESKYKDLDYAERAYGSFASHLLRSTTTRAAIFATIHVPATELLMQKLDAMGLECFVGKVNMNRNSPVYLREISTNQALRDTERWICETQERYAHPDPALHPVVHGRSDVRAGAAAGEIRPAGAEPSVGKLFGDRLDPRAVPALEELRRRV